MEYKNLIVLLAVGIPSVIFFMAILLSELNYSPNIRAKTTRCKLGFHHFRIIKRGKNNSWNVGEIQQCTSCGYKRIKKEISVQYCPCLIWQKYKGRIIKNPPKPRPNNLNK